MRFEAVFSLGSNCAPAHQIRRYFGGRPSSPFDWLVTPVSSISRILRNDGADFCRDVSPCFSGASTLCANYGVLYHHEFRPDHGELVTINDEEREKARSKLLYKYNKMLSIARSTRTLFLRYGSGTDAPGDTDPVTDNELSELVEMLKIKLGHSDFEICYIRQDGYQFERSHFLGSVEHCSIFSDPYEPGVLGHDTVWDQIFSALGLDRRSGSS